MPLLMAVTVAVAVFAGVVGVAGSVLVVAVTVTLLVPALRVAVPLNRGRTPFV